MRDCDRTALYRDSRKRANSLRDSVSRYCVTRYAGSHLTIF